MCIDVQSASTQTDFPKEFIFLIEKMAEFKKIPTQAELFAALRKGEVSFPPFSLTLQPEQERNSQGERSDAVLELGWSGQSRLFVVEYKSVSTPAMVQVAADRVRRLSRPPLLWPMALFPYLSEERLQELEREGISGIDLCGNGVVVVPGEWLVYRTGRPNLYPQSFPIKNVFRGVSSLVARVFLPRPTYGTVGEVRDEIRKREGKVALSTVSKVLGRLEEELIVGRQSGEIRLLQVDKLLQRLVENYRPPEIRRRFLGKSKVPPQALLQREGCGRAGSAVAVTGVSSARLYGVLATEETLSVYCPDAADLLRGFGDDVREQRHFPNLELLETDDPVVSFDRRVIGGVPWASEVQTYLELATGGKREMEAAEEFKLLRLDDLVIRIGNTPVAG